MGVTRPLREQRLNPEDFFSETQNWFPRLCHAMVRTDLRQWQS
ncbi:hypothetical protein IWX63_002373 [Arthrobacter sp. CAN_A2]